MRIAIVLATMTACANAYQSARVLQPGKTQVIVGVARAELDTTDNHVYFGEVQVRAGLDNHIEGGLHLARTPGALAAVDGAAFDIKRQITPKEAPATLSFALPVGVLWSEENTDFNDPVLLIAPTAFIGVDLSSAVELVLSPKVTWALPDAKTDKAEVQYALSVGLRFYDETHTSAVHPEISILRFTDGTANNTAFSFGLAIVAGN